MTRFAERAQQILETATLAAGRGEACSEMTILIGSEGGIQMIIGSDWPLESLARERGARAAYRVSAKLGKVTVEGREGDRKCQLESDTYRRIARALLT